MITTVAPGIPSNIGVNAATTKALGDILELLATAEKRCREYGALQSELEPLALVRVALKTEAPAIADAVAANEVAP